MKIGALISQSFQSILHNKVRSGLTILGIVIGIGSVIALVGLGKGLQANVATSLGGLGTTRITLQSQNPERETAQRQQTRPGGGRGGFTFGGGGGTETLTEADYEKVRTVSNITAVSPEARTQVDVTKSADAAEATAFSLVGVSADYFGMQKYSISHGETLSETQISDSQHVVAIGEQVATDLFGEDDPIGKTIYLKDTEFTVTGVLAAPENASPFNNPADNLYTGYKTWLAVTQKTAFSSLIAEATSEETVEAAADSAKKVVLELHGITDETKANVGVSTSKDLLDTVGSVASSFTAVLAGIAAISLLVGGIGIMNIMLVTVTERTREIGLRRAVGAKKYHIMLQFLVESVLLTLIGGGLGLLLGIVLSTYAGALISGLPGRGFGGPNASQIQGIVDMGTVLLAVGVSAGIGIVFGLFPALKAANLDPVEALRYE